ncbi:MAG: TIR domain-containing protein [Planctomycetota bacterium]
MTDDETDRSFDAFLSYASESDFSLVRQTKHYIEAFHKSVVAQAKVSQLVVCVDGIDFDISNKSSGEASDASSMRDIVAKHLKQSKWLVVFGSPRAADPKGWVQWEVEEFIRQRDGKTSRVLLVVSHGYSQAEDIASHFPPAITERSLQRGMWYDMREIHPSRRSSGAWGGKRSRKRANEARAQLAAHLNGKSAGDLLPRWHLARKRKRYVTILIVCMSTLVLAGSGEFLAGRFDRYEAKAAARQHLANVGHVTPAIEADWDALASIASASGNVRDSAVVLALSDEELAARLVERVDAFARAVAGLDPRRRQEIISRAERVLTRPTDASGPLREFAIALIVSLECDDTEILRACAEAWKGALSSSPDSGVLRSIGVGLSKRLPADEAANTARFLLDGTVAAPPSAGLPALEWLVLRSEPSERKAMRARLFDLMLAETQRPGAGWSGSGHLARAVIACSAPAVAPMAWINRLRAEVREASESGHWGARRHLLWLLGEELAGLERQDASGASLLLLRELESNPERISEVGPPLARALSAVHDEDSAREVIYRLTPIWYRDWSSSDSDARHGLSIALERLARLVPPDSVEQLTFAIVAAMIERYTEVDPDRAYHHVAGLRRPFRRLLDRTDPHLRDQLVRAALGHPDAIETLRGSLSLPLNPESAEHARRALFDCLDALVATAPESSERAIIEALAQSDSRRAGDKIASGVRNWEPERAGDMLAITCELSGETPSATLLGTLPGLVEHVGKDCPDSVLRIVLGWFDASADEELLQICFTAEALAAHPFLAFSDADRIHARLLKLAAGLEDSFTYSSDPQRFVLSRAEIMTPRLSPEYRRPFAEEFVAGRWPPESMALVLEPAMAERVWTGLTDRFEDTLDTRSQVGDRVTYLGPGRVNTLVALANRIPSRTTQHRFSSFVDTLWQQSSTGFLAGETRKEGLVPELEPVLAALAEGVPIAERATAARGLLRKMSRAWPPEDRAVLARVLAGLLEDTDDELLIEILKSPVATGPTERALIGERSVWSIGLLTPAGRSD